ncbi:30S ribosomal protein S18 [Patescibacteria group bacterium]|nr:30S ribosomal protein S18 [Patescibacteria group bacterium]
MRNCYFCTNNFKKIDYKEAESLKNFTDSQAKILPKKQTYLCVKHQRRLALAIKRARFLALLPFVKH